MRAIFLGLWFLLNVYSGFSQLQKEVEPPFHIKTAAFFQDGKMVLPMFQLNDNFHFEFDDLHGDEADYYFEIVHCDYDWKKSELAKAEYLNGIDGQRIQDYSTSFNTVQLYCHYRMPFPNRFMSFRVSGNYIIQILNSDREVVFSRKFVIYEDRVSVPMVIKRPRTLKDIEYKQNVEFSIKSQDILFQAPLQNVKVWLLKNGDFKTGITNIKPQYTIGNDLIYRYDKETQFWGGNEYRFFENKDIRAANNFIAKIESKETYIAYLYPDNARANQPYTYAPDVNGIYQVQNLNSQNNAVEADYAWVYFRLVAPTYMGNDGVYINGMFNNWSLAPEFKMDYNTEGGYFEKALILKQGFTNYQYVIASENGKIDYENAPDGNFYQTENNYFALVYYRENGQRYDRIIGKGSASSIDISN